jgi:hypothetical protein
VVDGILGKNFGVVGAGGEGFVENTLANLS